MECKIITRIDIEKEGAVEICRHYSNTGADAIILFDNSLDDSSHDANIDTIKEIADVVDIPLIIAGNVKRLEDVKKYLYAGGELVLLDMNKASNKEMIKEASDRFGSEKIGIYSNTALSDEDYEYAKSNGASIVVIDNAEFSNSTLPVITMNMVNEEADVEKLVATGKMAGVSSDFINESDIMSVKFKLKAAGIPIVWYESSMKFSDFKLNSDGMIPVIVQDYKTAEVLMLAYMNEEAFNNTIQTGRMTYYSRSREELWEKGLTSGHFQYVKSLTMDCDNDTLLAKVFQVGAACHTGNKTCFFNNIMKKDYKDDNPLKVFEDVYNVILDRKVNPKEGSYTNYLFDKGIDKILKKCGEEATEIIIAAKNPNPEEIKYEISDFLYHVMVLMAEKNVSWEDITKELSRR